jgi:hypothetical protein
MFDSFGNYKFTNKFLVALNKGFYLRLLACVGSSSARKALIIYLPLASSYTILPSGVRM